MNKEHFNTTCVNGRIVKDDLYAYRLPMYFSNTYKGSLDDCYARYQNPNRNLLEDTFSKIYATDKVKYPVCRAVSSGLGAFSSVLSTLSYESDRRTILVDYDLYIEVRDLLEYFTKEFKVNYVHINDLDELKDNLSEDVAMVFVDSCPYPTFPEENIKGIADTIHQYDPSILLAVDNSNLSCYYYNPFDDDADIVIESLGKYCCGHGDTMGGVVLNYDTNNSIACFGNGIGSMSAWMISRSMSTMALRLEKANENADLVYAFLKHDTRIKDIHRCVAAITFRLPDDFSRGKTFEQIHSEFERFKHIKIEYSFGQDNTVMMISDFGKKYIRIAVGLEDVEDIVQDLRDVFARKGLLKA